MKHNVMQIIDREIGRLETMMANKNKHLISTDTLRTNVLLLVEIDCNNDESEYMARVGFGQLIQRGLWENGYRSVRNGFFVNLDKCEDVFYLQALVDNKELDVNTRMSASEKVKRIRNSRFDGQSEFVLDEHGNLNISEVMTEEEFLSKIMADAV